MPGRPFLSRSVPRRRAAGEPAPVARVKCRALLVIDNRPLQREAWAEFHTARKRLEKAAHDLHRHENIDRPAYEAWLHRTFPVLVTTLRELLHEVTLKSHQVEAVQAMAMFTGRSAKKLWREQKEAEANPKANDAEADNDDWDDESDSKGKKQDKDNDDGDWGWGWDDEKTSSRKSRDGARNDFDVDDDFPPAGPPPAREARDIYRRLVQHLHPDRGGAWTDARKRLWHEVQQAWAAGDADWLARLEIEWETANDVLGPTSPLSRLRRAIDELHAARRDTERRLREYRGSAPWRFTLTEKKRHILHERTDENFTHDIGVLRRQLEYLNATIASWEAPVLKKKRPAPRWNQPGRSAREKF